MSDLEKQLTKTNESLLVQLEQQSNQIQRLTEQVEYLTRKLFGTSSEKTKDLAENQLSLFDNNSFFDNAETTEESQTVEEEITYRRKKQKGRKADLTKHLPVEE